MKYAKCTNPIVRKVDFKKYINFGFIVILVAVACNSKNGTKWIEKGSTSIRIIPHPQELYFKNDSLRFSIKEKTAIVVNDTNSVNNQVIYEILNQAIVSQGLSPLRIISENELTGNHNGIIIGEIDESFHLLDSLILSRRMMQTPPYLRSEEYRLDVDPSAIVVIGKEKASIFWAITTLIQLIQKGTKDGECTVAPVRIYDFPDMPIRGIYYGFHFKDLTDLASIDRGKSDIIKFASYKLNMIGLDNHHYGHLEMEILDGSGEKYWQRFSEIFDYSRRYYLQPRIGGWARWFDSESPWSCDPTTLEGIRTTQKIKMSGIAEYPLKISSGHIAYKVIHDFNIGHSWDAEPVIVTDESEQTQFQEGCDYILKFGKILTPYYDEVISGEGEPKGYPLRRGISSDSATMINRTLNSRIRDGQTVKVTFSYIGPDPWRSYKVRYCRSDPRLHIDGPDNYIWRWCVDPIRFLNTKIFNLEMDEIRVFAWDNRCLESGKTRSQIFVDDIKYYYDTIRKNQPDAVIMMWSDMLDPNHNASLYKTEEIVEILSNNQMNDIILVPWRFRCAKESIELFYNKGFSVLASSQSQINKMSVAPIWAKYLRQTFKYSDKPFGLMHAPWDYDYDTDEGKTRLETMADHAWSVAPYIIHSPITKVRQGIPISVEAIIEGDQVVVANDQVIKGPLPILSVDLFYRFSGYNQFTKIKMRKQSGKFGGMIPAVDINSTSIEYYILASNRDNTSLSPKSAPAFPYTIKVIPF